MTNSLTILLLLLRSFYSAYLKEYRDFFEAVFFIDRILFIGSPMDYGTHSAPE
jgi:hypothetical protein